jgi:hypothetical protein
MWHWTESEDTDHQDASAAWRTSLWQAEGIPEMPHPALYDSMQSFQLVQVDQVFPKVRRRTSISATKSNGARKEWWKMLLVGGIRSVQQEALP